MTDDRMRELLTRSNKLHKETELLIEQIPNVLVRLLVLAIVRRSAELQADIIAEVRHG